MRITALTIPVVLVLSLTACASSSKGGSPDSSQAPTVQLDDETKGLASCKAANAAIKKDELGIDLALKRSVLRIAASSGVPALQEIAAANPGVDILDARAGFRAVAAWCDDHDVAWPN